MKISLDTLVDAMKIADDNNQFFWNNVTGQMICLSKRGGTVSEYKEKEQHLEENWHDYCKVPNCFDVDELGMMEEFVAELEDEELQDSLGAFLEEREDREEFARILENLDLAEEWEEFRNDSYHEAALEWCRENQIEYID